jgi:hypothetical protein
MRSKVKELAAASVSTPVVARHYLQQLDHDVGQGYRDE